MGITRVLTKKLMPEYGKLFSKCKNEKGMVIFMSKEEIRKALEEGKSALGIEFGSTRIKAVLVTNDNIPVAAGSHEWENRLENNIWTYSLDDIWKGLQDAYTRMAADTKEKYGITLTTIGAIGFSGMMHGYMAFDKNGKLLVPFRTWRNTITEEAAEKLTKEFHYNIPQRWSIAHLYQAILNGEDHVKEVTFFTTLAGYVHWKMTGEKVLGVGEASCMFPIDVETKDFNKNMISQFDKLVADKNYPWKLEKILPKVLVAGENAGTLTEEGSKLLDVSGNLKAGIPLCPPEGDAGTGMTATNSIAKRTGNVSAGTSIFAMIVLEKELTKVYPEIDLVTTPTGNLVGMVHCNNCTSDLNAWVNIFKEFAEGRPLFVRTPDNKFNLANFMRANLFSSMATLKVGLDIMLKEEGVQVDRIFGHGGLFKTKGVGQRFMAAAMNAPVSVMETAGEGGAWGIALLASYMLNKKTDETLADYLLNKVFAGQTGEELQPQKADVEGFDTFIERYKEGLPIEHAAVENM